MAGRPKVKLDTSMIEKLASIQCSNVEIASILGCHPDTLRDNYSTFLDKGRQHGIMTLRRKQWDAAMQGNITMQIWLGKQYLDQRDKNQHEVSGPNGKAIETRSATGLTDEQLNARISAMLEKGKGKEPSDS